MENWNWKYARFLNKIVCGLEQTVKERRAIYIKGKMYYADDKRVEILGPVPQYVESETTPESTEETSGR